jgi:retinol dehydrogenase-12
MGSILAIIRESFFPPRSTFKVDDVPDLAGKVIIITGANTGEIFFMYIYNVG